MRTASVACLVFLLVAAWGIGVGYYPSAVESAENRSVEKLRRPVAIVADGDRVLVANRRSGTISVIQSSAGKVVAEYPVATRIADMIAIPGSKAVFVLDDGQNRLLTVSVGDADCSIVSVAKVPLSAVKLAVSASRRRVFVNSKWSRELTAIDFSDGFERAARSRTIALPFASHEMLLLDRERILLVADAFGGRIGVVDAVDLKLLGIRRLGGHNIRGLSQSCSARNLRPGFGSIQNCRNDRETPGWPRRGRRRFKNGN